MACSAASLGTPLKFSQFLRYSEGQGWCGVFGCCFGLVFFLLEDAQVAASILTLSQSITLCRNARCQ